MDIQYCYILMSDPSKDPIAFLRNKEWSTEQKDAFIAWMHTNIPSLESITFGDVGLAAAGVEFCKFSDYSLYDVIDQDMYLGDLTKSFMTYETILTGDDQELRLMYNPLSLVKYMFTRIERSYWINFHTTITYSPFIENDYLFNIFDTIGNLLIYGMLHDSMVEFSDKISTPSLYINDEHILLSRQNIYTYIKTVKVLHEDWNEYLSSVEIKLLLPIHLDT